MFARSMTPNQLLARHNYALVRVDEDGNFLWAVDFFAMDGSAISSMEEANKYVENNDNYEVVDIDHGSYCDGECSSDMQDAIDSANAALNRARETVADVETMLDDLRAECDRLRADNDRYDTALSVVMKTLAHECELICKAHMDDSRYMTKDERHVRKLDRKRYETLSRINSLIDAATLGEYGAILPPFPQLS